MTREEGISSPMYPIDKDKAPYFYWVLKLGDYSSGWLLGNSGSYAEMKAHPTTKWAAEKWDKMQETINFRKKDLVFGPDTESSVEPV